MEFGIRKTVLLLALLVLPSCSAPSDPALQGYVEGEYVRVAASIAGKLTTLAVQRGAQVKAGDLLFTLEQESEKAVLAEAEQRLKQAEARLADLQKGQRPDELAAIEARYQQAQAMLRLSEQQQRRQARLFAAKVVTREQLDEANATLDRDKAQVAQMEAEQRTARLGGRSDAIAAAIADVEAARAERTQAQWKLEQKTVSAPLTGLVQDTLYNPGDWVPAGSPVVSLLPPENLKVRFFIPETMLGQVRLGQEVLIHCDGCNGELTAKVSFIAPQAEYTPPVIYSRESRAKLVFMLEARLDPADAVKLHTGQPVDVRFKP